MMEEKLRILKMVEEGTITAEQAAELMNAMGVDDVQQNDLMKTNYTRKCFGLLWIV